MDCLTFADKENNNMFSYDFLTDEHREIRAMARQFAQDQIAPIAEHFDHTGEFPIETVRKLGALGFMGIEVPEEYDGAEMDPLAYAIVMEEISKVDASHGTIVSVNNSLYGKGVLLFGTDAQKKKYLAPVARGEKIGAYSLTEPMSGSDSGTMRSRAVLNAAGTHYVVNGVKSWVTNGPYADYIVLFTMTEPENGHNGVTAFIIETDKAGFSLGKTEPKLGIRASATCETHYDNYEVPVENILGEVGKGFKVAMTVLDHGRIGIAAQALGIATAAYEASVAYAKEREAFGQKIGQFQMIQSKLADMYVDVESSRMLTYHAALESAKAKKTGGRFTLPASAAKLKASETAMWVTTEAIQVHGGMGFSKEMPLERYFRDAKITQIYEGTSEVQRMVIARSLTGLR
ncbi:MAG: alkylation response protein AidB-like acyl-CoA dehydrogenase [Cellvibrionaceae bacterium]